MDGSLVWSNRHHQSGTLMPSGAVHPIMPGHSRPKDGVASLAYDPGIHALARLTQALRKKYFR
jgi:hypothetical protein